MKNFDAHLLKGHLCMAFAATMWGLMAPLAKDAMQNGLGGLSMVGIRVIGGCLCFWLASLFVKVDDKLDRKEILWLAGAGMFAIIFNQCNYIIGLSITSPLNASIMTTTMPILTMILAAFILKEPVTWKKLAGVMLGCTGALTLILATAGGGIGGVLLGDVMCIAGQLSYAFYLTAFKKVISRHHPITCQKWMMLSAVLVLLPFAIPAFMKVEWDTLSGVTIAETVFVVVGGTFLSFLFSTMAQQILRPTVIAMYNYLQPIVACTFSVLMGLGVFTIYHFIAAVLVFSGVYLVNASRAK